MPLAGATLFFAATFALMMATILFTAHHAESASIRGDELTLSLDRPFGWRQRLRLAGATVRVEPRGTSDAVILVERDTSRLILGGTSALTRERAEIIADRIRHGIPALPPGGGDPGS